jgi:hypothetical protein
MKFRNIFWGMILILVGILFTLENLNVIDFDWYNLWRLWPVILLLWGISIIPIKNIIKVVLVLVVFAASTYYMMQETVSWRDTDYSISFNDSAGEPNQEFTIPYEDSAIVANLEMEIAASSFLLIDESYDLLDFEKNGSMIDYKYSVKQIDSTVDISIYTAEGVQFKSNNHNRVNMSLNPQPIWNLSFEIGAADADFDLSGLKISRIDIEGGAAAIKIKLGDKNPITKMGIETGASSIEVKVPKESYCELDITSVLSGKNISGFEKVDRGHYITNNIDEATNKIYIVVETAVSSYSIIRY